METSTARLVMLRKVLRRAADDLTFPKTAWARSVISLGRMESVMPAARQICTHQRCFGLAVTDIVHGRGFRNRISQCMLGDSFMKGMQS